MQQDIINNLVMASFYMSAEKLNFDEINSMMDIYDAGTREANTFRIKEFAKDYWFIETEYEPSEDINVQIQKIRERIESKTEIINDIRRIFHAECGIEAVIKILNEGPFPAVYFERDLVEMAAGIGAEIGIDFT